MTKESTEREIATILSSRYVAKAGRYRVRLAFRGDKAEEFWMSPKQLFQLEACFSNTPKGYSRSTGRVIGIWDGKGYYRYSRFEKPERVFYPPPAQDLSDLEDAT